MTTKKTQAAKVANALINGAELTAKQISARYGVANVRAVISQLRSEGYAIFLNKRVSSLTEKYILSTVLELQHGQPWLLVMQHYVLRSNKQKGVAWV